MVSSDPLRAEGLALAIGDAVCVLLANLTGEIQHVQVAGLAGRVRMRNLDERTAARFSFWKRGDPHPISSRFSPDCSIAIQCV
jgi:hypothetical protein